MTPSIIFEDENLLIINKPSGIVVHPFDHSTEKTLIDFLEASHPEIFTIDNSITLQDGRIINLGGTLHKIDRETSGVMVFAKDKSTFDDLQQQFRNHTIEKTYYAIVEGIPEQTEFTIDAPLGRNKKDYKQIAYPENPRGELRQAITKAHILANKNGTSLVELHPKTGRTHQLRAHMAYIGHPILGDKAYGSSIKSPRIKLHAQAIKFTLFENEYCFEVPIPEDFF